MRQRVRDMSGKPASEALASADLERWPGSALVFLRRCGDTPKKGMEKKIRSADHTTLYCSCTSAQLKMK